MTREELLARPNVLTLEAAKIRLESGLLYASDGCYIIVGAEEAESIGNYWRERNGGTTPNRGGAWVYLAVNALEHAGAKDLIELLEPRTPEKPTLVLLTIQQATSHLDKIGDKMCRWWDGGYCAWAKDPLGTGYTANIEEAVKMAVKTLLTKGVSKSVRVEMLDQEEAARIAALPYRKCEIGQALPATLIAGMKLAPANPTYRGLILRETGVMPPDTLKTFEELKDWIEWNVEPGKFKAEPPSPPPTWQAPVAVARPGLRFELEYSETEIGSCRYTVRRSGLGDYMFDRDDVLRVVEDSSDLDEVMTGLNDEMNRDAWDNAPDMDDYGDYDYDRYDLTDSEDANYEHVQNTETRRARVVQYLRTILSQEEQERIGILVETPMPEPEPEIEEDEPEEEEEYHDTNH